MKTLYIDDAKVSHWAGGSTAELAIAPDGAAYGERSFLWRLSAADVQSTESTFSPLPDYNRILTVRRGSLQLRHDEGPWYSLRRGEVTSFDGGSRTVSRGKASDFNLMIRKGAGEGFLSVVNLPEEMQFRSLTELFPDWKQDSVRALFVSSGDLIHLNGNISVILHPEEMVLFEKNDKTDAVWIRSEQEGMLIGAEIRLCPIPAAETSAE